MHGRNTQVLWMLLVVTEVFACWLMAAARGDGYRVVRAGVVFAGRCESAVMCVPSRDTRKKTSVVTGRKREGFKRKMIWT